jgi:hypothetical protein
LEGSRERRVGSRAKKLVAGELFHAELVMGVAADQLEWPRITDVKALFPVSAWAEYRAYVVDLVDGDAFDRLVGTYAKIEIARELFQEAASRADNTMSASDAVDLKKVADTIGRERRILGRTTVLA